MSIPVLPAFPSAAESIPAGAAKTDVGTDGSVFESLVAESVAENTPPSANKDASPKDGASAPAADTQKAPEEKQTNAQTWLGIPPELPSEAVAADPSGAKPAGQQNAGVLAEPVTAPMPNIAHAQPSAGEPVQQGNAVSSNGAPALAVNAQNTRRPQGSSEQTDVKHAGAPNTLTDEPHAAPATVSAPSHEQSEAALLAAAKPGTPIATAFTEPQEAAAAAALLKPAPQRSAAPAHTEQASAANELAKSVAGPLEAPGPAGAAEDK
ncbi:MAG: hypothetical protein ACXW3J_09635, partial [Methylocystis sp.]